VASGAVRGRFDWQSVIVLGRYEELSDKERSWQILTHAMKLISERALWWQSAYAAHELRGHAADPAPVVFCVHVAEITGHRATPDAVDLANVSTQPEK
jgi:uncharacterized protein